MQEQIRCLAMHDNHTEPNWHLQRPGRAQLSFGAEMFRINLEGEAKLRRRADRENLILSTPGMAWPWVIKHIAYCRLLQLVILLQTRLRGGDLIKLAQLAAHILTVTIYAAELRQIKVLLTRLRSTSYVHY